MESVNSKKTKEELVRLIQVYIKNSKALCDIMTLYSYCVVNGKKFDLETPLVLDTVINDLEDKCVTVPFYANSISELFEIDRNNYLKISAEIRESDFSDELFNKLRQDYRTHRIEEYFKNSLDYDQKDKPFDLVGRLCQRSSAFVSELLCSNIPMPRKIEIIERLLNFYIRTQNMNGFDHIVNPRGAGFDLSRTLFTDKEVKMKELFNALKENLDKNPKMKESLIKVIIKKDGSAQYASSWLSYLQQKGLVDFMNVRRSRYIDNERKSTSICSDLCPYLLNNFREFYELEEYANISEDIRFNDSSYILTTIEIHEISKFIDLPNYQPNLDDIKIIAKRVYDLQDYSNEIKQDLIDEIMQVLINKMRVNAKNRKQYKLYCEFIELFETESDYSLDKKKKDEEKRQARIQKEREIQELQNARQNLYMRIYNMSESLLEQVPIRKTIKELSFKKENNN
ncbi:MAG: hypothetical protein J1F35_01190 [Erysipelotrichales bacterium]|nr:hypothetical protein [Erysipelotrichales bacterium]